MALTIPDETLAELRMDEQQARVEIACRLYDADKLSKPAAARFAGLSRPEFEAELLQRGLPWVRIGGDDYLGPELESL